MQCDHPIYTDSGIIFDQHFNAVRVPLPCGKCPNCKRNRVNSWVFRLMEEDKVSTSAHFITLTYGTHSVPISDNGFMTLLKSDFQDFMKRLRKLCDPVKLRYYCCGEYGTKNRRPHYHAIIFNCPDPNYFVDAWSLNGRGIGRVDVGTVTRNSIAYTMKYIDKHTFKTLHGRDDRIPEFSLMSKRLGASYLSQAVIDYHTADVSRMYVTNGPYKIAMPRYYRKKIYTEYHKAKQLQYMKEVNEKIEQEERLKFTRTWSKIRPDYTFDEWKSSQKQARYKRFYHQKQRTL